MRTRLVLGSITATLLLSGVAFAQTNQKSAKDAKIEAIEFPDDKLLNPGNLSQGMTIGAPHVTVRTIITRPRTHFVPELLKTIEGL